MRIINLILIAFILLYCSFIQAQDFTDTHNDGSLNGWTSNGTRGWSESNGAMNPQENAGTSGFLISNFDATNDGIIEVDITSDQWNGHNGGVILRWTSPQSYYFVCVKPGNQWDSWIKICRNTISSESGITVASNFTINTTFTLRIEMVSDTFKFYIDGVSRGQYIDATHSSGSFGYAHSNSWVRYTRYNEIRWWNTNVTEYSLTVATEGNGSVDPQSSSYPENTEVTVTATPESGWEFSHWSGDASGSENPITITMDTNKIVTAVFTQIPYYQLRVNIDGNGSVDPDSGSFIRGTEIELTATPDTGWSFSHWTGDIESQANPVILTMSADRSVTAHFVQIVHMLTTETNGHGTVTPQGGEFAENSTVNILATPDNGWRFTGWSGDVSGNQNPVSVVMRSDRHVVANFEQIIYPLTVRVEGNGEVSPDSGNYPEGTQVVLTATPDSGWVFSQWSGDASGSTNPLTVVMNDTMVVIANFVQRMYTLVMTAGEHGTVSPESVTVAEGSQITVTARADSGFEFDFWSGDFTGSQNPVEITMDGDKRITANFKAFVPEEFTITTNVTGNGTVLPQSSKFLEGSEVEFSATPDTGWIFSHWEGNLQGKTNPVTITIDSSMEVRAVFIVDNSTIPNSRKIAISSSLFDHNNNPVGRDSSITIDLFVRIYDSEVDGNLLYTERFNVADGNGIVVDDGYLVTRLGEGVTSDVLIDVINANQDLWVEIGTGSNVFTRIPLTAAAYSLR